MSSIVTFNIQYDPAVIYEGDFDVHNTLVITALTDNCNIYLKRNNTPSTSSFNDRPINIVYSLDEGETWLELNLESQNSSYTVNLGTLSSSKSIYIRGNNLGRSTLYGLNICTDKSASVSGNIMSLFYRKNPSNTLPQYNTYGAFQGIFSGSKIANASQLSLPTTLEDYCYAYMFENCSSLTSVPTLSATTLEEYCYQGMFKGCTSITTAPELPATTLVTGCYANMFENCTSLNYIHIYSEIQIGIPYTTDWVKNVAPSGTFVGSDNIFYTERGDHGIPTGWYYDIDYRMQYFTVEYLNNSNYIYLYRNNNNAPNISLYYSLDDGKTWSQCYSSSSTGDLSTAHGKKILLKGNNTTFATPSSSTLPNRNFYKYVFLMHGNCKVYGNIMSLLNGDNFRTNMEFATGSSCNFAGLFGGDSNLTDISHLVLPSITLTESCYELMFASQSSLTNVQVALPATSLSSCCYKGMFADCTSLTTAPELPATTLADYCYMNMFENCTSLTTAPELPATTLANYCYAYMFYDCTLLTTAPELPATTLADDCYMNMFAGCTSLVNATALPATTSTNSCYMNMFAGCTSLVNAPALPATTLAPYCYAYMFADCTSLVNAPALPATTLVFICYAYMFAGCTSLNYVKCLATDISASSCTDSWLDSVASSGTFVKAASMNDWTTGASGIPSGWTVQNA